MEHLKYFMQSSDSQSFSPHLLQSGPAEISASPWPLADCLGKGSFDPPSSQSTSILSPALLNLLFFLLSTLPPEKSSPKLNFFLPFPRFLLTIPFSSASSFPLLFIFCFILILNETLPEVRINGCLKCGLLIHQ